MRKEIPIFPGCVTPSEVAQAVKRGLKVVKFFPAEPAGGVAMIKAMAQSASFYADRWNRNTESERLSGI